MRNINKFSWVWIVICLIQYPHFNSGSSFQDDLSVTYSEKVALDKFRQLVASRLPQEYMKQDIYLIKWLRAQNLDIGRAEEMLMQNLRWRKENKMDDPQMKEWTDMEEEYPYTLDSMDKKGQPVLIINIGDWDMRRASVTGKLPRVRHYFERAVEKATVKIREMQNDGKNVTRFIFILDLDSFNLAQHACSPCIATMLQFLSSFENHFPGFTDKIMVLNAGPVLGFILDLGTNALGKDTRERLHVFTKDKSVWQKYLLQHIDKNQLPREFGGTKD